MQSSLPASAARPHLRAVIADDSQLIRKRLLELLDETGRFYLIAVARDALSAVDATRLLQPHLVILDIRMAGNGISALKKIKQDIPAPIVIMFSAFATHEYRAHCLERGADYVFDKALEQDAFLHTVEQFAANFNTEL